VPDFIFIAPIVFGEWTPQNWLFPLTWRVAFATARALPSSAVISDSLLRRLQAIQNAEARIVTGTRRREHITPDLRQLHWLPVRQRIEFKLAVFGYKAINGLSPQYFADNCQLTSTADRWGLRSFSVATCKVPRTRTSLVDHSFTVAGPRLWNNLPLHLRDWTFNILCWSSAAGYGRRTCFAEDSGAEWLIAFACLINLHLHYITFSQSVSVPCQNSGVGGSQGFFLPSFSHHLNEVQRSKPSHALHPPKQGTSLPPPSSLTLDSSCQCSFF